MSFYLDVSMTMTYTLMTLIISFQIFADIEQTGAGLTVLRVVSSSIEEADTVNLLPVMDENGRNVTPARHGITLRHVSFAYGENEILHGVTLTIPDRTMTAFVVPLAPARPRWPC